MRNKKEFLKKLSKAIDKLEDKKAECDYFSMNFANYDPDNLENERKLSYFQAELRYDFNKKEFTINDLSEPFTCAMYYSDCEKRGYCNGDC